MVFNTVPGSFFAVALRLPETSG